MNIDTKEPVRKPAPIQSKKTGFLQNLMDSLFRASSPEVEKKRRLKIIAKNYSKCRYHNFYKTSSIEVMPPLAKLFFDIYKIIAPAQTVFRTNDNMTLFKRQILNYSLSEKQSELLEHFDENYIKDLARQMPLEQLKDKISQDLLDFSNEFSGERIVKTENLLKAFLLFKDFCCFDYFLFLKKFSPHMVENNFSMTPTFSKINAEYVVDDLKDFVTVAFNITDDKIMWDDLFEYLKSTRGSELVPAGTWKKIIAKIRSIQSSNAFELMIQHITQNPVYSPRIAFDMDPLIEPYLEKISDETNAILSKINNAQKDAKATNLCGQIFGTADLKSLKNYVHTTSDILVKKNLHPFKYCEPLNYLKTFILEYVKTDIREFFEVVVIRGQWDQSLSAPMSSAYQDLLKTSDQISTLDNDLAEDGTLGSKIKTLLPKTQHDPGAENIINRVVDDSNKLAYSYLVGSTQGMVTIAKTLKLLIEDYVKPKPVMVQNWRELERYLEHPMKEFSVNIYKKIYLFVQLMQQYLTN